MCHVGAQGEAESEGGLPGEVTSELVLGRGTERQRQED